MKASLLRIIFAFLLLSHLAACSSMDSAWQYTRDAVDPNPSVDLAANTMDDPDEEFLAKQVTPVDMRILDLTRFLSAQDAHPDPEWFELTMMRFPWLDGVMTVDTEQKQLYQYPGASLKPLDPSALYNIDGEWVDQGVQMHIDYTELGPEMYIAKPMFSGTDWLGLLVVYFDPRVFFNFCPNPEDFVILDPKGDIWTVEATPDRVTLAQIPWPSILRDQVRGTVHIEGKSYTWLARYIGKQQIVYAVQDKEENEQPWLGLFDDQNIYVTKEQERTVKKRNYATFAQPSEAQSGSAAKKTAVVAGAAAGAAVGTEVAEESSFWSWLPWVDDPQKAAEEAAESPAAPKEVLIEGAGLPPGEVVETEGRVLTTVEEGQRAEQTAAAAKEASTEGGFWSWLPWVGSETAETSAGAATAAASATAAGTTAAASGAAATGAEAVATTSGAASTAAAGAVAGAAVATAASEPGTEAKAAGAQAAVEQPVEQDITESSPAKAGASKVASDESTGGGAAAQASEQAPKASAEAPAKSLAANPAQETVVAADSAASAGSAAAESSVAPAAGVAGAAVGAATVAAVSGASSESESSFWSWLPWVEDNPEPAAVQASAPPPAAEAAPQTAAAAKSTVETAALERVRFHEFPEDKPGPGEGVAKTQPKIEPEPAPGREVGEHAAAESEAARQTGNGADGETWFSWLPWFDDEPYPRHGPAPKTNGAARQTASNAKASAKTTDADSQETWFSWLPWFDDKPVAR